MNKDKFLFLMHFIEFTHLIYLEENSTFTNNRDFEIS